MSQQQFYPTGRFLLTLVVFGLAVGVGAAMLQDSRSAHFEIDRAIRTALLVCAVGTLPAYLFARWYGKVAIDPTGISARDTLGRWRTIRWESLTNVRSLRLPGLPYVLLSSRESRWSVWLAGYLSPHEVFLEALAKLGPRAEPVRAHFESAA